MAEPTTSSSGSAERYDAAAQRSRQHWDVHLRGRAIDQLFAPLGDGLVRYFARTWPALGSRYAIIDGDRRVTYDHLASLTATVAGRLRNAGCATGDRVLIGGPIAVDTVVAIIGALRAGLVVVPTHTSLSERELSVLIGDAEPVAAVLADPGQQDFIRTSHPSIIVSAPNLDSLPSSGHGDADIDRAAGDDVALLCYTSGTTGVPKGAQITHANLLAGTLMVGQAWAWSPDDTLYLCLPLFHVHGLCVGIFGTLTAGATVAMRPGFDAADLTAAARGGSVSMFFGVPTMYERLAGSSHLASLGHLRLCVSGSAPLPTDLFERLTAGIGTPVLERYGMTETLMNVSNPLLGERRAGSVGLALPGVEFLLDGDGIEGEILLRGPNVSSGYWRRPDSSLESRSDGWFRSGDIGRLDPDGYLRIVGRSKELIISGGYNVYPREVEDVLRQHPAIADAAVVGEPSKEWGEQVVAFVTTSSAIDLADLEARCREALVYYKVPKRYIVIDEFPRNALGKVLKHELVASLRGG